jgi:hypothetical protein
MVVFNQAALIRDELTLSSWLLVGATIQSLLLMVLPARLALWPPALVLALRFGKTMLMARGFLRDESLRNVMNGRYTAQMMHQDGSRPTNPAESQMLCFVLSARSNQ